MLKVTFSRHDYSCLHIACMEKYFILHNITSTVITIKIIPFFLSSDFHVCCIFSSHEVCLESYKCHKKTQTFDNNYATP